MGVVGVLGSAESAPLWPGHSDAIPKSAVAHVSKTATRLNFLTFWQLVRLIEPLNTLQRMALQEVALVYKLQVSRCCDGLGIADR